jgi:hypothetical protein
MGVCVCDLDMVAMVGKTLLDTPDTEELKLVTGGCQGLDLITLGCSGQQ